MATAKEARQAATSGKPAAARPTSHWKQAFRRRLLAWYRRNARDLEWRNSRDPYRIWVSEIMLQQTQVATVADYFTRFLTAFPNVEALAAAPEEQVLRLWEGLGYYRRARQIHRAAIARTTNPVGLCRGSAAATGKRRAQSGADGIGKPGLHSAKAGLRAVPGD